MPITIPSQENKKWNQTNSGDVFGNLYSTKNINFDREGYLSLSPRQHAYYRENSSGTDFDDVVSIVFSPIGDMVFTSDKPYEMDLTDADSAPLVVNADAGLQVTSDYGDAIAWNGRIYQTGNTATNYWDGASWTTEAAMSLTSGVPHPMTVFESLNYLAIATNKNIVKLFNTGGSLIQTLTIPAENQIQWLVYRDSNLYIGTKSLTGRNGRMYVWNGASTSAQKAYDAKGEALLAGCEYGNSIATISSIGQLLLFNGGGFTELANLPVYYTDLRWQDASSTTPRVARRGIIGDGELLYINIDGRVMRNGYSSPLLNQPSGLWCYDPKVGLYHRAGYSQDYATYATISSINITTNTLTLGSSVETQTGDVVFVPNTSIGGLVDNRTYYAIRVSGTEFQLAETYNNAISGDEVDFTTDPGGPYGVLVCPKIIEFGNTYDVTAGALAIIPESRATYDFFTTRLLWGGRQVSGDSSSSTQYSTLQSFCLGENRGSFITQKIFSDNIEDTWNNIVSKARGIFNTNDKLIVKYRTEEREYFPIYPQNRQYQEVAVTWASTSSFTVVDTQWATVEAGDEIEIIKGGGAGYTAHISTITESSGTYTVTLDETIPLIAVSDRSLIIVNNWKKGAIITSSDTRLFKKTSVNLQSKWIQIKCELRGEGTQVEELQVVNKTHLPTI